MGIGIQEVIEAIIERLPPPDVDRNSKFRALIFDSSFDKYRGALSLLYVKDGSIKVGDSIQSCYTQKTYEVKTLSVLRPQEENVQKL